ncbi:unnamed protein product [Symbiodinium natans]|uniref:Uncharacterized protein n=1 Tax=Symbiodinium natans TaxID=878477 RepID=A0A812UJ35_9DINO|nr:unnamed protein product [Symbiodinium natans]
MALRNSSEAAGSALPADDENKSRREGLGRCPAVLSRALAMLLAFLVVPSARSLGTAAAATFAYLATAALARFWRPLSARGANARPRLDALRQLLGWFTLSCWFWACFWPLFLYFACWNNGWIPGFRPLRPGYRPERCNGAELAQEILQMGGFANETVHWDASAHRCDCDLPDYGAEGGRCKTDRGERFPRFTVISALIDAGRRDRSGCDYLRMFGPHMHRHYDLVFYGEAWALEVVDSVRAKLNLRHRTRLRLLEVPGEDASEDVYARWGRPASLAFHHLREEMQLIADRKYFRYLLNQFQSGMGGKMMANYAWATNEKVNFVVQAARENYFQNSSDNFNAGQSYFVWLDVGAGHGFVKVPEHFCACNVAVPGTVTLFHQLRTTEELFEGTVPQSGGPLRFRPLPLGEVTMSNYLSTHDLTHHFEEIMGTFWGGDLAGIEMLWESWNATVHQLFAHGAIDHDQGSLCLVASSQPKWLRYIASNFFGVLHLC